MTGEPRLLYFATLETQKVVVIIKNDESEEAYLDSLKCSVEDSEDLLNSSLVDTVLSSTAIWCDSLLNDYHWHFRGVSWEELIYANRCTICSFLAGKKLLSRLLL